MLDEAVISTRKKERTLPPVIGYPWEPETPIMFTDVFGRTHSLPQVLCRDEGTLIETMKRMYLGMVDHDGVKRWKHYEVLDEMSQLAVINCRSTQMPKDHLSVLEWNRIVQPGCKLAMNLVKITTLRARPDELTPLPPRNRTCPKCGTRCFGISFSPW